MQNIYLSIYCILYVHTFIYMRIVTQLDTNEHIYEELRWSLIEYLCITVFGARYYIGVSSFLFVCLCCI